jgi:hypothetical protein
LVLEFIQLIKNKGKMGKPTLNTTDFAIILALFMVGAIVHQKVVAPRLK